MISIVPWANPPATPAYLPSLVNPSSAISATPGIPFANLEPAPSETSATSSTAPAPEGEPSALIAEPA